MPIALVTGAYGFVGRHVARCAAERGYTVRAIGHGGWSRSEWSAFGIGEWHDADITMSSLLTYGGEPDVIFHCAGSGSVGFSMTHPYQDFERTVTTTLSVLEFARQLRGPKVVIPSSAGVYGKVESLPIATDAPLNPVSPYGMHKKMAEDLCRSYARHFGLGVALVRLFSVYGIGIRKQLLWDASTKMTRGDTTFAGTGRETRDWLHVEDAASLMLAASEHASPDCPIANGGAGVGVEIAAILGFLADALGIAGPVSFVGETRPGDPSHYTADIRQALAWGWHAERHLEDEVRAYAEWFKRGAP